MKPAGRFSAIALLCLLLGVLFIWVGPQGVQVPAPPRPDVALVGSVDRILIEKSARRLTVFRDGQRLKSYVIKLGFSPIGDKLRQGDGRTPEGLFRIDRRNAASAYHLSLGIDYPQPADRLRATKAGYDPGGDIMIHGQPNSRSDGEIIATDWTAGCIALPDAAIVELWAAVKIGTAVEIRP
jgi:murein L,D-transpeptidase YafK